MLLMDYLRRDVFGFGFVNTDNGREKDAKEEMDLADGGINCFHRFGLVDCMGEYGFDG